MVTKWFLGSLFLVAAIWGLVQITSTVSAEDKPADAKAADCCTKQLACCKEQSACCVADAKLGCCEKGMKCCAENRACCQAIQKCCLEGKACCDEGKACCGPKGEKSAAGSVLPSALQSVKKCCAKQTS